MSGLIRCLAVAIATFGIGCSDSEAEGSGLDGVAPQCQSSDDCSSGTYCHAEHLLCLSTKTESLEVAIAIAPPSHTDYVASHLSSITISGEKPLDLTLPQPVVITGLVKVDGNVLEPSVKSTIIATAKQPIIPGTWLRSQTEASADGYELRLLAGVTYAITITVKDGEKSATVPKWRTEVTFDSTQATHDFFLPSPDTYPVVTGRLMRLQEGVPQPLADVDVTAVEAETRQECTTSRTNNLGVYTLLCPVGSKYALTVSPATDGPVVPAFHALVDGKSHLVFDEDRTLADVVLPEQARETVATVQVVGPNGPAAGVSVTVSSPLPDGEVWVGAVLRQMAVTDQNGNATLQLLQPGAGLTESLSYEVAVRPKPSSPLAMHTHTGWDLNASPNLQLQLEPKFVVRGEVVDFSGSLVAGAQVVARTTLTDSTTGTTSAREHVTQTKENGNFEIFVDPGSYDFVIIPNESSGLPRFTRRDVAVLEDDQSLHVTLAAPTIITGHVLRPDGAGTVGQTSVDFYQTAPTGGAPTLLGRGESDDTGRYVIIIATP